MMRGRFAVVVGLVLAGGVYAGVASGAGHTAGARGTSFVSLWQGHGPTRSGRLTVELFSLRSGRPLARLATEPGGLDQISPPHPGTRGRLWITQSSGPQCRNRGFGDCSPKPSSCRSRITRWAPGTGRSQTVATFPHFKLVSDAVPSPRRGLLVLLSAPCVNSYFNHHFLVEDLHSHRRWSIGADARPCHALSAPAWNSRATQLVFVYGASRLRRGQRLPGGARGESCLVPRAAGVVIVSASHGSKTKSWKLFPPRSGCQYTSAAFDNQGVAAFEACSPGRRRSTADDDLGPASVVQLDRHGRVLFRIALKRGANPGTVQSDPRTGVVLVTQNQTYRQHHPTYNWVWQLKGHHLRLIARYPFDGELTMSAQPW